MFLKTWQRNLTLFPSLISLSLAKSHPLYDFTNDKVVQIFRDELAGTPIEDILRGRIQIIFLGCR